MRSRAPRPDRLRPSLRDLALAAILCAGAGSLYAQQEIDAVPLTDDVWVIEGAVDRIGVVSGPDGTLLIDAGYEETEAGVRAALERIGVPPPEFVVTTHWHHAFANAAFADDAVIVGHASLADRLARANWMYDREVPAFPETARPDVAFTDSLRLSFAGREIRIVHYDRAHTESDAVVFLDDGGVVFTGDLFVPHVPWVDVESGGDVRGWLAAVDDLLTRVPEDAILVPGHDRVSDVAALRAFRDLLAEAIERVEEGIVAGRTRNEIASTGLSSRWDDWEGVIPIERFLETVYDSLEAGRSGAACRPVAAERLAFVDGRWWDGHAFVEGTRWSVDGWLTRVRPEGPVRTIDLDGGYVIPPLADAHTHRLAHADGLAADIADHREVGVLYAMNMDPMEVVDASLLAAIDGPCGVDVAYTEGVIAPSWSVIADFYRMMAEGGRFGDDVELADLSGEAIHLVDDADDLAVAWPRLAARNPSFLKVVLAFTDEWETRRGNPDYPAALPRGSAKPGLDPALLPAIVRRARAAGIRVAAHIETAADFRVAVAAGVDLVAHLPAAWQVGETAGYADGEIEPWLLTEADARAAAEAEVVVVTTTWADPDDPRRDAFAAIHRHNVALLRDAGVRLALGSDGAPGSTVAEAHHLEGLKIFSSAQLLDLATRATARAIFPGRRIGRLGEGYEASFVVLAGDPLVDPSNLGTVRLVVKDGVPDLVD